MIRPWTYYVNANESLVWATDAVALLGVRAGVFTVLVNPVAPAGAAFTGLTQGWTTLQQNNCSGWTVNTPLANHNVGIAASMTTGFINNGGVGSCDNSRQFYCIEQ